MENTSPTHSPDTQLFRDVFNASPIGIAVENLEGQLLFANPALCSMLGFSEAEMRSKQCADFSPPEDAEKDWSLFQQLRAGSIDQYQLDKYYFRRDGSLVWGRLTLSLLNSRPSPLVLAMVEDITERKQAERELAQSNERLHLTLDVGRIGGWEWDVKSGQTFWFGQNYALLGAQREVDSASEQTFWGRVHPEDRDWLRESLQKALRERLRSSVAEFRVVWPDQTVHWLRSEAQFFFGKDGQPERMLGISTDITERKSAEAALSESEERLRLAVQAGNMFAYSWDAATDVIERSGESAEILGLDREEAATGAAIAAMVHRDDKKRVEGALAKLTVQNPTLRMTYRIVRPDGAVAWLERNSRAYFDEHGKVKRIVGMIVDVTERKRAEEALRTSEKRMRLAQQAARMGTFECNVQEQKITWAPELEALYGLQPGSFGGKLVDFENLIHPADREAVSELVENSYKTGQPTTGEWRIIWPDGSEHWIAGRWQVFMNDSGEPLRALGVNIDVTEHKRAEQAVVEMTRKLIEAQEQERARIGRELHDDINQRLALLSAELERLHQSPSEFQSRVQELRKELRQISDDVQALSHDLHSSKMEYLGAVSGMKSWCKQVAERHKFDIDFRSDLSGALPLEIGLPLFRVLQEGVNNSIKHSGEKRVEVQLREDSEEIHLLVRDSGVGFDLEGALRGKGLGLTTMRERVRLINGTMTIESKPVGGTTIHVRVPVGRRGSAERVAS
jgi:PAS domain S-box-containing protein